MIIFQILIVLSVQQDGFRLAGDDGVLSQAPTESGNKGLPEFVRTGVDVLDVDNVVVKCFSIFHLEGFHILLLDTGMHSSCGMNLRR